MRTFLKLHKGSVILIVIFCSLLIACSYMLAGPWREIPEEDLTITLNEFLYRLSQKDDSLIELTTYPIPEGIDIYYRGRNYTSLGDFFSNNPYFFQNYWKINSISFGEESFKFSLSHHIFGEIIFTDNTIQPFSAFLVKDHGEWKVRHFSVESGPNHFSAYF